ncbi:uncharacterized protein LOC116189168 [Punica granatum]|uniref:Uncharacterized protein LOC116189168 n=1 Tax=Punica granatum TaxID=22663 RepID=A0A218XEP6_PUNGR|nr:uncharacterized protein LOC116189168 [Punica granatum]OWM82951.1 hypothetical protein CDL15_Pgr005351 [Punica granatum]
MLENPPPAAADPPPSAVVKRYAPPNQRNRSLSRRKSGERFDRSSNPYALDGDKLAARNIPIADPRDTGIRNFPNDSHHFGLIPLEGCCSSEAYQLLSDRWAAAIHCCNDPSIDPSERPLMYSGSSASVWGHIKLPHQLMFPGAAVSPGSQMDFMAELQRSMRGV